MKHIIVTGATSFIGLQLVKLLSEREYRVSAVVRPGTPKAVSLRELENVRVVEADMKDYRLLSDLVHDPCDVFFSLAWNGTRGADRNDAVIQEENYCCSMDALSAVLELGCGMVVSAGSQAEYGQYNCKLSEETEERPVTEYGRQKLRFFRDASSLCSEKNVDFKEPRFFSLYGEDDSEGTMIISMIRNMLEGRDCHLTECIQMWDFLYISDAVAGLLALIETPCTNGVYNFGSGIAKPLKQYVEEMYRLTHSSSRLLYGSIPYPETGIVSIEPDVSKLIKETGWAPVVTFSNGIERIISKYTGK